MFSWRNWSGHYKMTSISFRVTSFRFRADFFRQLHFELPTFTQKRKSANHCGVHFSLCTRQEAKESKLCCLVCLAISFHSLPNPLLSESGRFGMTNQTHPNQSSVLLELAASGILQPWSMSI